MAELAVERLSLRFGGLTVLTDVSLHVDAGELLALIGPALEEPATELGNKVTVAKINIDENPNVPTKYGVRGIPTLMIFSQGQVAATKVGALPKSKIKEWIESSI